MPSIKTPLLQHRVRLCWGQGPGWAVLLWEGGRPWNRGQHWPWVAWVPHQEPCPLPHPPLQLGMWLMVVAGPERWSSACHLAMPAPLWGAGAKDEDKRFLHPLEGLSRRVELILPGSIYHDCCLGLGKLLELSACMSSKGSQKSLWSEKHPPQTIKHKQCSWAQAPEPQIPATAREVPPYLPCVLVWLNEGNFP